MLAIKVILMLIAIGVVISALGGLGAISIPLVLAVIFINHMTGY